MIIKKINNFRKDTLKIIQFLNYIYRNSFVTEHESFNFRWTRWRQDEENILLGEIFPEHGYQTVGEEKPVQAS